jgi:hypothetical protein
MTITYIITKFLKDGGQSSLQMSTVGYVWEHECIACGNTLVRKMLLCSGLSQTVEHKCTAMKMQINVIYGAETHFITQDQELQNCTFCQQSDVHQQDHGQSVLHNVVQFLIRSWNPVFTANIVKFWQKCILYHQSHMAAETVEIIQKHKFELLAYPAYSPDLFSLQYLRSSWQCY